MTKKRKRNNQNSGFETIGHALDMMLAGHHSVVGPDFIITRREPDNADIGHLDPKTLRTFDNDFVKRLVNTSAESKATIPDDLKGLSESYTKQRELLSSFHGKAECLLSNYDMNAAKELGNFDPYMNKIVLRNNAEVCVFFDYIALYRMIEGKRTIINWRMNNPKAINKNNKAVVSALEKARFAVLRIDQNLAHGAIKVTNVITGNECILIDKALNSSHKEGCFFICSILDLGDYVMTSGGGIPLSPVSDGGKSALTLLKKHLSKLQSAKRPVNKGIIDAVREIYGFCLRSGALENMTIS